MLSLFLRPASLPLNFRCQGVWWRDIPLAFDTWEQRIQSKARDIPDQLEFEKKNLRILKHFLILNWTTGSRALGIALQLGLQILLQVKGAEEKAFDTLNAHSA